MLKKLTTTLKRHCLPISLLLHVLLILSATLVWLHSPPKIEKSPELYIPSYLYKPTSSPVQEQSTPSMNRESLTHDDKSAAKNGIYKRQFANQNNDVVINNQRVITETTSNQKTEAVHLIGDKKVDQPLIKLLGKAIYAHLVFPKIAVDFHIRGITSVGFLVHPDGNISDIELVKSSGTEILDNAALSAINQISPVKNVNQYLQEPKYLVANIIFR